MKNEINIEGIAEKKTEELPKKEDIHAALNLNSEQIKDLVCAINKQMEKGAEWYKENLKNILNLLQLGTHQIEGKEKNQAIFNLNSEQVEDLAHCINKQIDNGNKENLEKILELLQLGAQKIQEKKEMLTLELLKRKPPNKNSEEWKLAVEELESIFKDKSMTIADRKVKIYNWQSKNNLLPDLFK